MNIMVPEGAKDSEQTRPQRRDIRIGDTVAVVPFFCREMPREEMKGRVVYIHPEFRYYAVDIVIRGHHQTQCFKWGFAA